MSEMYYRKWLSYCLELQLILVWLWNLRVCLLLYLHNGARCIVSLDQCLTLIVLNTRLAALKKYYCYLDPSTSQISHEIRQAISPEILAIYV